MTSGPRRGREPVPAVDAGELERIEQGRREMLRMNLQTAGVHDADADLLSRKLPKEKLHNIVAAIERAKRNLWNGYAIARDLGLGVTEGWSLGPVRSDPAARPTWALDPHQLAVGGWAGPFAAPPHGTRGATVTETHRWAALRYRLLFPEAARLGDELERTWREAETTRSTRDPAEANPAQLEAAFERDELTSEDRLAGGPL